MMKPILMCCGFMFIFPDNQSETPKIIVIYLDYKNIEFYRTTSIFLKGILNSFLLGEAIYSIVQ